MMDSQLVEDNYSLRRAEPYAYIHSPQKENKEGRKGILILSGLFHTFVTIVGENHGKNLSQGYSLSLHYCNQVMMMR